MSDDKPDLDAIEKPHYRYTTNDVAVECFTCGGPWPCQTVRLVRRVRELEAERDEWKKEAQAWQEGAWLHSIDQQRGP